MKPNEIIRTVIEKGYQRVSIGKVHGFGVIEKIEEEAKKVDIKVDIYPIGEDVQKSVDYYAVKIRE